VRALVCDAPGEVRLKELPLPRPERGEVVVRVKAALTCGTDLKLIRRGHPKIPFPLTLGHELAGVVHASGPGAALPEGARVTAAVTGPCGSCGDCVSGRENLCSTAFDDFLWGAFAEYVRVPARVARRGLKLLPDTLAFPTAALLDPLASVLHGLSRVPVRSDSTVLLWGAGPIALLFALALRRAGTSRVFVLGRRASRLRAFEAHGVFALDRSAVPTAAALKEALGGRGADLVVDTTGDAELVHELVSAAARGGSVLLFAGAASGSAAPVDLVRVHYDEVSVVGSFHYTPADADAALELLASGAIPEGALVTATSALEDYERVFERARSGEGMKTAFLP
jgi:L-iditol 2-dehydrogenase